jgi:hypothetical protein
MYSRISNQALAMMVRHARFIPANDQDTCISVFLTAPYQVMCGFNSRQPTISDKEWELGFQDNCSANLDKIRDVLKVKVYACTDLHNAIRQLQNWRLLLAILFGPLSASAQTMKKIISRLEEEEMFLAEQAHNEPRMMPGLLQYIYNLFRRYFRECSKCSSSNVPPRINISLLWEQLNSGYTFTTVPLSSPVKRALQQSQTNNDNKNKQKQRPQTDDSTTSKKKLEKQAKREDAKKVRSDPNHPGYNKWFNKKNSVDDAQFQKLWKKKDNIPHFNGTDVPMCMNFHLRGGCRLGESCKRAETHKKLSSDSEKALRDWRESTLN